MAELIFKSAGVSSREIDLSAPTQATPLGVPAGVVGTANEGPAFVPVTVANFNDFEKIFGKSDGEDFGVLAANQWLRSAQSCTYVRVLGIGDGKKRNTTGVVNRAGFFVGDQNIQTNGNIGDNSFANAGVGSTKGRTYFLGCFMSESAGSTVFSSAGMQKDPEGITAATATITTQTAGSLSTSATFVLQNAAGVSTTFRVNAGSGDNTAAHSAGGTADVFVQGLSSLTQLRDAMISRINATTNGDIVATASGNNVLLTQGTKGASGNKENTSEAGSLAGASIPNFSGGVSASVAAPILRGILLAPSGVILHLSSAADAAGRNDIISTGFKDNTAQAAATRGSVTGRKGSLTGSVSLSSLDFTMFLNGHKGTSTFPNILTASFDITSPNYFANKFNTDPLKIEQSGHLLYSHYDIHSNLATVTGSGVLVSAQKNKSSGVAGVENVVESVGFLLTSSLGRTSDPDAIRPNYEDFRDRFKTAVSPFVVTQSPNQNLFRIHALSDGVAANTRFKISIENITRINDTSYPTFDLIVRNFYDSDEKKEVLETFRGVNLDPSSSRYIARIIGDQHVFFEFDKDALAQKINVTGNHPVRSNYIRVETTSDLDNGNIDLKSIPCGFRGPLQVVSSGSIMCETLTDSTFISASMHQAVLAPPIPYRQSLSVGSANNKRVNSKLFWGMQFNEVTSVTQPNKQSLFNETFDSYVNFLPTHRKDGRNFFEASDTIGNHLFSLEHIKVRTGSDGKADPDQWVSASYVRNAKTNAIGTDDTLKTEAFNVEDLEVPANRRYAKFSFFLQGGFDGTDIFNADKRDLANNAVRREIDNEADQGGSDGPTTMAYKKGIEIMGAKSEVDIKLLAVPGIRVPTVTDFAVTAVENRFDALYLMDIEKYNTFGKVITGSADKISVTKTVTQFKNRGLNSSFAAAYFPDVVMQDPTTGDSVVAPATVAVLGAFSLNDAVAHPWFAPAGFTRGALDAVESADVRLNRENLDDLYDADINPLTAFPGTGVVVWGQKTLLANASALDRVNVRRLLINVRRAVRNVANTLLFEPNRQETLDKFNSLVNPILQKVQEQGGVDRYRVIIDSSTTTQADIENNTIRGKIFLQPTRAVEFVALDFVVTNAGANI